MQTKNQTRKYMKQERLKLSSEYVSKSGELLLNKLLSISFFEKYKAVFIYISAKNEVSTVETINYMLKNKIAVYVPKILNDGTMTALEIKNTYEDLHKGKFGIYEPVKYYSELNSANQCKTAAIVPGVAFDRSGNRIGFGAGYYDMYFSNTNESMYKIGVCYDFQLLDSIPCNENDVKMNEIITVSL